MSSPLLSPPPPSTKLHLVKVSKAFDGNDRRFLLSVDKGDPGPEVTPPLISELHFYSIIFCYYVVVKKGIFGDSVLPNVRICFWSFLWKWNAVLAGIYASILHHQNADDDPQVNAELLSLGDNATAYIWCVKMLTSFQPIVTVSGTVRSKLCSQKKVPNPIETCGWLSTW